MKTQGKDQMIKRMRRTHNTRMAQKYVIWFALLCVALMVFMKPEHTGRAIGTWYNKFIGTMVHEAKF